MTFSIKIQIFSQKKKKNTDMVFRDEKDVFMHQISDMFLRDVKMIYLCKKI